MLPCDVIPRFQRPQGLPALTRRTSREQLRPTRKCELLSFQSLAHSFKVLGTPPLRMKNCIRMEKGANNHRYWELRIRFASDWLGGLDSNQDSQIQSLESYRLDDLPAAGGTKRNRDTFTGIGTATIHPIQFNRDSRRRQPAPHFYRSLATRGNQASLVRLWTRCGRGLCVPRRFIDRNHAASPDDVFLAAPGNAIRREACKPDNEI